MARRWISERAQRELQTDAAINIQRVVRGFLGRQRYLHLRDRHERFLEESEAALRIQCAYRGHCGRKIYRIKKQAKAESEAAARTWRRSCGPRRKRSWSAWTRSPERRPSGFEQSATPPPHASRPWCAASLLATVSTPCVWSARRWPSSAWRVASSRSCA